MFTLVLSLLLAAFATLAARRGNARTAHHRRIDFEYGDTFPIEHPSSLGKAIMFDTHIAAPRYG